MRIAVIGAGAMGSLFGGMLSAFHEVTLVDSDDRRVKAIREGGVSILDGESRRIYFPSAAVSGEVRSPVELVIVFVKSMYTDAAIRQNEALIDGNTVLMSLQNGAGQEKIMSGYASEDRILRGVTQHNASVEQNAIRHGGGGMTYIGGLAPGKMSKCAEEVALAMTAAGIETMAVDDAQKRVWEKLAMNASSSALSAVLRARHGICIDSESARTITERLIREVACVANALGYPLNGVALTEEIEDRLSKSPMALTSICADIRDGRATEVEFITGTVVREAQRMSVPAPTHEMILMLIHALEDRAKLSKYMV
ncbi:MAG: 2-dehydropantoate 2-reductase [Clostridia bacterium]|nr:2-dehydropantoate 2-reductase [Clostridia bacterium]